MTPADRDVATRQLFALTCPRHGSALRHVDMSLACDGGCAFPVVDGIPRFVEPDNYAAAFGLQWNRFARTQLDSATGTSVSRTRLARMFGGSLDGVRGQRVLEAGCGAGRFTELFLQAGATVFATDLSTAVVANHANCSRYPLYFVCQADLRALPMPPASFDVVACIGVVQHTPDPEDTMRTLCAQVKPGGLLVMDHYAENYPVTPSRRLLRSLLLKRSQAVGMRFCQWLVTILWPVHRMAWHVRRVPILRQLAGRFVRYSPVVDHHYYTPDLSPVHLYQWALLDTHDTLTDRFKHLRTAAQLTAHLTACGMERIEAVYAGNGVEVRAVKPRQSRVLPQGGAGG